MVPIFIVAWRAIISGVRGVRILTSKSFGSVWGGRVGRTTVGAWSLVAVGFLRLDLNGISGMLSLSSTSLAAPKFGEPCSEPESDSISFPYLSPWDAMIALHKGFAFSLMGHAKC